MTDSAEARVVETFLARTARRLAWLAALHGAAVGLTVAMTLGLVIGLLGPTGALDRASLTLGASLAVVGLAGGITIAMTRRRSTSVVAVEVERRAPRCRNVVITAAELLAAPGPTKPYVLEMVTRDAADTVRRLNLTSLFPARRAIGTLAAISVVWIGALGLMAARDPETSSRSPAVASTIDRPSVDGVDVAVSAPAYSGLPNQQLRNPTRVEALAGSRITIGVRSDASSLVVETLDGRVSARTTPDGRREFSFIATGDGFIAIEPSNAAGPGMRRLIGLTVTPDQAPRVRISAPGKDMFLADASRSIDVTVDADDDLALAGIRLRYTKVSGSGERFTFVEGEVPVSIERTDGQTWKARGSLPLDSLALERGDMVVYRGVAIDRRPGASPTESDAFLIEITSPGMLAAGGFSLDDQQDKYALSQQMVILKTERLIARMTTLSPDSLTWHSQLIAAEQRAVRAEFVFMMGGEVAEEVIAAAGITDINEEAEAASEADLGAGRMVNRGRVSLVQAIRLMSRASTLLNSTDPRKALPEEKAALVALQQAFSRSRYLLRALTQRERLDLSRRLTGVLETASRDSRPATISAADPRAIGLRRALAGIATLAAGDRFPDDAPGTLSIIAQSMLQIDPSSGVLQRIAVDLNDAGAAISSDRVVEGRRRLDTAATQLTGVLRGGLGSAPYERPSAGLSHLRGALADALRRPQGDR